VIERLQAHYGFTRAPFGRDLAPGMLHRHTGHGEAVARITWCIGERGLGVLTGEVGVGKTVAVRAALAALDPTRHTVIYLPNPTVGARGIHHAIVTALGGHPLIHRATLIPQAADALATEHAERGRTPVLVIDEAHLLDHDQLEGIRMLTNHDMDSRCPFACLLVGQPTLRRKIKLGQLAALDQRIAVRRRGRADPHHQPRLPPRGQQPRRPVAAGRVRHRQGHRRREHRTHRRDRSNDRMNTPPTT